MDGLDPRSDDALIRQDHITVSLVNPAPWMHPCGARCWMKCEKMKV